MGGDNDLLWPISILLLAVRPFDTTRRNTFKQSTDVGVALRELMRPKIVPLVFNQLDKRD